MSRKHALRPLIAVALMASLVACSSESSDETEASESPSASSATDGSSDDSDAEGGDAEGADESPTTEATPKGTVPGELPWNPAQVDLASLGEPEYTGSIPDEAIQPGTDGKKAYYLTFDDGPDPTYTPQILDVLEKHDAKATFFILGENAEAYPEWIPKIQEAGHALANHSYTHTNLSKASAETVKEEMTKTDEAIGGRTTCMRPPYGSANKSTRATLLEMDKWVLIWDLGSRDWQHASAETITSELVAGAREGALTLMHDGGGNRATTVAGLDAALGQLKEKGYEFPVLPMCQLDELPS